MKTQQNEHKCDRPPEKPAGAFDESAVSPAGGRRWTLRTAALVVAAAACIAAKQGCTKTETVGDENQADPKERCHETLSAVLHNAAPTRLGLTTSIDHTVSRLNDWHRDCGKNVDVDVKLKPATQTLLKSFVSADDLKKLGTKHFSKRDVRHIRNTLLMRQIVKFAPALSDNDLDKAVDLFYYVVRNIDLVERKAGSVRLPPFRILLMGRGTAEDRAWIFSALLRQLRIPSVILRPKPKTARKTDVRDSGPFLVGVLHDEHTYLFDTRLGLPIPGPDAAKETTPLVRRPATLDEFVNNPAIQKRLNLAKHQYPIVPASLRHPVVQLVGHRSLWSKRMKKLYYSLTGANKLLLFDALDADADGLISRIAEFGRGRWNAAEIGIWPYPETSFRGFEKRTDIQNSELTKMQEPLEVPIPITVDPKTGSLRTGRPTSEQRQARIRQLMGKYADAIKDYLGVRSECIIPDTQFGRLRIPTQDAIKAAMVDNWLWVATVKLEQGDEGAIGWLELHLVTYSNTERISQARYILALLYRGKGKFNAALTLLDQIGESHPQKHGFSLLAQRWRRQKPAEKPSTDGG